MRRKAGSKPQEQPEVTFALTMHERLHGVWRRHRAGTWVSTTAWTIEVTQQEFENLTHRIAALRAPEYRPRQNARKVASHVAA